MADLRARRRRAKDLRTPVQDAIRIVRITSEPLKRSVCHLSYPISFLSCVSSLNQMPRVNAHPHTDTSMVGIENNEFLKVGVSS